MTNETRTSKRIPLKEFSPLFENFNNPDRYITKTPTGLACLDQALGGGLTEGVHTICAWPGTGKTALALNIAINAVENDTPVLFFSYEVPELDLATKIYSIVSNKLSANGGGFSFDNLRSEYKISTAEQKLYVKTREYINTKLNDQCSFFNCRDEKYTVNQIIEEIEFFINEQKKLPLVIIDYLQVIEPESETITQKTSIDHIIVALHNIATKYHFPSIAISSITKNYTENLTMFSCAESARIPYSSVTVWGLSKVNNKDNSASYKTIKLEIFKNRYGPGDVILNFAFDGEHSRFWELTESQKTKSKKTQTETKGTTNGTRTSKK